MKVKIWISPKKQEWLVVGKLVICLQNLDDVYVGGGGLRIKNVKTDFYFSLEFMSLLLLCCIYHFLPSSAFLLPAAAVWRSWQVPVLTLDVVCHCSHLFLFFSPVFFLFCLSSLNSASQTDKHTQAYTYNPPSSHVLILHTAPITWWLQQKGLKWALAPNRHVWKGLLSGREGRRRGGWWEGEGERGRRFRMKSKKAGR